MNSKKAYLSPITVVIIVLVMLTIIYLLKKYGVI